MLGIRASPLGRYILVLLRGAPSEIWAVSRPHCSIGSTEWTLFLPWAQMALSGAAGKPRMKPGLLLCLLWLPPGFLYCFVGPPSPATHCLIKLRMSRSQGVAIHEHTN